MIYTETQLQDLLGSLVSDFTERNERIEKIRTVRRMQNKLEDDKGRSLIPDRYRKIPLDIHLPLVRDAGQRISASLTANYMKIIIPPWSNKPEAVKASGKREVVLNAGIKRLEEESGRPTFRRIISSAIYTGWGVHGLWYKPDHWSGFPRKGKESPDEYMDRVDEFKMGRRLPFMWRHIPTETFYPVLNEGQIGQVMISREVPIYDCSREFNLDITTLRGYKGVGTAILPEGVKRNFETITVTEYWDDMHCQYLVGTGAKATIIEEIEHGYGQVPFFICYGDQGEDDDPTFIAESPMWPVAMMQPILEALLTLKCNIAWIYGYPTPVIETPLEAEVGIKIDEDTGEPAPLDWELGDVQTLGRGQKVTFPLQQASAGPDIDDLIQFLLSMADRASLPALARGEGVGSDWSGYLMAQLNAAIRNRLQEMVNSIEGSLGGLVEFWQCLIEKKLKTPMVVDTGPSGGILQLGPKDIRKYYKAQVRLNADIPQNMAVVSQTAIQLVRAKLWSRRRGMEAVSVDDPTAEAEEILLDELLEFPEVKALAIQLAGKEVVEALQKEAGAAAPPPGMAGDPAAITGPPAPGTPPAPGAVPLTPEEVAADVSGDMGPGGVGGRPEGAARLPGGVPGGSAESTGAQLPGPSGGGY